MEEASKKIITLSDFMSDKISEFITSLCNEKDIRYAEVESRLNALLDRIVDEYHLPEISPKIEAFKKEAFFYAGKNDVGDSGRAVVGVAGLESLETWYFNKVIKVFGNGNN